MKPPGTIYLNKNRYWWKVKLPGQKTFKQIPLVPLGGRFATKDKTVAIEVAKAVWKKALGSGDATDTRKLSGIAAAYLKHCQTYYQNSREYENVELAVRSFLLQTNDGPAEDFGPLRLQECRQQLIDQGLSRSTINSRIGKIKRMFKWACAQQLIPVTTYQALTTVEGLREGRSHAKEPEPIRPVSETDVCATLPYLSNVVAAMVQLQLLTGMRSTEVCTIRPADVDTSGTAWLYRPQEHKTAHRGHNRIIALGPKAQTILRPFLVRNRNDYCFTPAEATGTKRQYEPRYNYTTYRNAIRIAIKTANSKGAEIPHWHPHQLRHTAGTKVRKELGKEAARAFLGHRNPKVTDDYAEIDMTLATKAALRLG